MKAIKINPSYSEAYSCASNIFKKMGKLNESINYQLKCIKISPNKIKEYSNLGLVLREKGKISESNDAFKKCLQICNGERELTLIEFQTKTDLAINYLIQGNRKEVKKLIDEIEKRKMNTIEVKEIINKIENNTTNNKGTYKNYNKDLHCIDNKEKSLNTTKAFFSFIKVLSSSLKEAEEDCEKVIPHIGESHSLSFAHQNIKINNQFKKIQPIFVCGAKAYHLGKRENNNFKASLEDQIKLHNTNEEILISFGEIDCRREEGILQYASKRNNELIKIIEDTVDKFVNYMEGILEDKFNERYYLGIPAPQILKEPDDLDKQRKILIKEYNSILKNRIEKKGSHFIDIYKLTVDKNNENNGKYMADNVHLSPAHIDKILGNNLNINN